MIKQFLIILFLFFYNVVFSQCDDLDTTYFYSPSQVVTGTGRTSTYVVNPDSCFECDGKAAYVVLQYPATNPPYSVAYIWLKGMDFQGQLDSASCIYGFNYYMKGRHYNDTVSFLNTINPLALLSSANFTGPGLSTRITETDGIGGAWHEWVSPNSPIYDTTSYTMYSNLHHHFATDFLNDNAGVRITVQLSADLAPPNDNRNGYDTIWIDCVKLAIQYMDTCWCHKIGGADTPMNVNDTRNDSIFSIHGIVK